jgi:hypothetical protein
MLAFGPRSPAAAIGKPVQQTHEHAPPSRVGVLVRDNQAGPEIQAARYDGSILVAIELEATNIGGRDRLTANFVIPRHSANAAHRRGGAAGTA